MGNCTSDSVQVATAPAQLLIGHSCPVVFPQGTLTIGVVKGDDLKQVYDGDTLTVECFDPSNFATVEKKIRILGLDTQEMRPSKKNRKKKSTPEQEKKEAIKQRDYLRGLLNGKCLIFEFTGKATFDRLLARIWAVDRVYPLTSTSIQSYVQLRHNIKPIDDLMIESGHGIRYYGGVRDK